ncbi:MAG: hypothetical protein PHW26_06175 [Eubacteriales bacterium]|nr:hypothetical protein [Eubacteriales bacterium]
MKTVFLILLLGLMAVYIWLAFPPMIRGKQFGDLAVNVLLILLCLYSLPSFIWGIVLPDMGSILSRLLRVPVRFLYRPWL